MKKMLIADDNRQLVVTLEEYAKSENYLPVLAYDGNEALEKFRKDKPDVVLLDIMMPFKDGFTVCAEIRKTSNVPILMITAHGEDFDKIMGLDIGADDYIVKPFLPDEVMARVRAIMRRIDMSFKESVVLEYGNLKIDFSEYSASINSVTVNLTIKEFELLWTLASNKNKMFTRDNLLDSIWGSDYEGEGRTVDKHIYRLREKLENAGGKGFAIKTVHGTGYRFEVKKNVEK
jgi:DNA-binding response OmpR family regulator